MNIYENQKQIETVPSNTILMTNFLAMNIDTVDMLNKIYESLLKEGLQLVILSTTYSEKIKAELIEIPLSLKGWYSLNIGAINNIEINEEIIFNDIEFFNDKIEEFNNYKNGYFTCRTILQSFIKELRPAGILIWSCTLSQSRILYTLAYEFNIPSWFMERGMLPGSLQIDKTGGVRNSSLIQDYTLFSMSQNYRNNKYESIKEYFNTKKIEKYKQPDETLREEYYADIKKDNKKLLVFFGQWDVAGGISKIRNINTITCSPIFNSSADVLNELKKIVQKRTDLILIFKPHPQDSKEYFSDDNSIIIDRTANIHTLMKNADLFAAIGTTVQYEALLYEKPIIQLGRSFISGKDICYELQSREELESLIDGALTLENFEKKIENSKSFIEFICDKYLFKVKDDSPIKNELKDFAAHLKNILPLNYFRKLSEEEIKLISNNNFASTNFSNQNILISSENLIKEIEEKIKGRDYFDALILLENNRALLSQDLKANELERSIYDKVKLSNQNKKWNSSVCNTKMKKAEKYFNENKIEQAESILLEIANSELFNVEAVNNLSIASLALQKEERALELIKYVHRLDPNNETVNETYKFIQNISLKRKIKYNENEPLIEIHTVTGKNEYQEYLSKNSIKLNERLNFEKQLAKDQRPFNYSGYCRVCNSPSELMVDYTFSKEANFRIPVWRESIACPVCLLNNRMRASIHFIEDYINPAKDSSIYITEQTTALFRYFQDNYSNVVGSEFLEDKIPLGEVNEKGVRNEDLTKLTFEDAAFDFIISLEVFEHVPDFISAFKELSRTLKPNGKLIFTVPFVMDSQRNTIRATLENGKINHLMEPEIHGDPINNNGCLCFQYFGWELNDIFSEVGLMDLKANMIYSRYFGYLGNGTIIFTAEKRTL